MKKITSVLLLSLLLTSCFQWETKNPKEGIKNKGEIIDVGKNSNSINGKWNLKEIPSEKNNIKPVDKTASKKITEEIIKKEEEKIEKKVNSAEVKKMANTDFLNLIYSVQNTSQYSGGQKEYIKKIEKESEDRLISILSKRDKKIVPLIKKEIEKKEWREKLDYIANSLEVLTLSERTTKMPKEEVIKPEAPLSIRTKISIIRSILSKNIKQDNTILSLEVDKIYKALKDESTQDKKRIRKTKEDLNDKYIIKNDKRAMEEEKRKKVLEKELKNIYDLEKNKKIINIENRLTFENNYLQNRRIEGFIIKGKKYDISIINNYLKMNDLKKNRIDYNLGKIEKNGIIYYNVLISEKGYSQITKKVLFSFNKRSNKKILKSLLTLEKKEKGTLNAVSLNSLWIQVRRILEGNLYIPKEILIDEKDLEVKKRKIYF